MNWERHTEYLSNTNQTDASVEVTKRLFEIVDTKFPGRFKFAPNRTSGSGHIGKCIAQIEGYEKAYTFTTTIVISFPDVLYLVVNKSTSTFDGAIRLSTRLRDGKVKFDYLRADTPNGLFLRFYDEGNMLSGIIAILRDPSNPENFIIRSNNENSAGTLYSMARDQVYNPSISLPTPQVNTVFMCNDMKNGEVLKDWFSYNSNPSVTKFDYYHFGGQRYLALTNRLCIKA